MSAGLRETLKQLGQNPVEIARFVIDLTWSDKARHR